MTAIRELRDLPQVEALAASLSGVAPDRVVRAEAREVIDRARRGLLAGRTTSADALRAGLASSVLARQPMAAVINATGVLLHTNLGRAPLDPLDARADGLGAVPIELALDDGRRHHRLAGLEADLCELTGAGGALVVNNNAAALLLVLSSLASGAEVVVSRGQLVEIGGSFRVPEIISAGGAVLREVGTTNRTHLHDFRAAIGDSTRVLLEVHPSNFEQAGFTAAVATRDLASLAHEHGVVMVHDIGSGLVDALVPWLPDGLPDWLRHEPAARQVLAAGADLVTFSGDKLLGGPQAGIICGDRSLLDTIRRHPLARAVRFDKVRAAHLHATVRAHLDRTAARRVPFWRMATTDPDVLERRATDLAGALIARGVAAEAVPVADLAGAGAAATRAIAGWGVAVASVDGPDALATALRHAARPVLGITRADRVVLSLRTVAPEDDPVVADVVHGVLAPGTRTADEPAP